MVYFFALFLAAAQPHRVHHLLENLPHDHLSHEKHSHEHDAPSKLVHGDNDQADAHHEGQHQPDCATQSVVKHSNLSSVTNADFTFVLCFFTRLNDDRNLANRFFVDLPFFQRAPPEL
jgi:hypothetical protein